MSKLLIKVVGLNVFPEPVQASERYTEIQRIQRMQTLLIFFFFFVQHFFYALAFFFLSLILTVLKKKIQLHANTKLSFVNHRFTTQSCTAD